MERTRKVGDTTAFRQVAEKRPAPAERPEQPAFPRQRRQASQRHAPRGSLADPGGGGRRTAGLPCSPSGGRRGMAALAAPPGMRGCSSACLCAAPARQDAVRPSSSGFPKGKAESKGTSCKRRQRPPRGWISGLSDDLPPSPRGTGLVLPPGPGSLTSGLAGAVARLHSCRQPGPRPCPQQQGGQRGSPGPGAGGSGRRRWARPWPEEHQTPLVLLKRPLLFTCLFFRPERQKIQPLSHLRLEGQP